MNNRKSIAILAALLAALLMLAACGPALTEEEAAQLTREATSGETGETAEEAATDAGGEAPAEGAESEAQVPSPVPLPTVTIDPALGEPEVTESGLQFYEMEAGSGRAVEPGDIVTMNIMGTLADGTTIADTYSDGQPLVATATEDDLFAGWLEGVLKMKEGGTAKLVIPSDLAFGDEGIGGVIPGGSTIYLDVEVVSAIPAPVPTALDEADFTTTDSGLKYYDIAEGEGDAPVDGQDVVVNYTAWVQDGMGYIASSESQGEPLTFTLGSENGVFPGWNEGVSTMKPGGKRQLIIPPDLALGEAGGGKIPPNATLVMEVELVEVKPLLLPTEVDEDDMTTTDSGLKYYDLVEGDGATPTEGQLVTVNYTGWLQDGLLKFDSSLDRGVPFTFPLGTGSVIAGWEEGLSTMKVGGKRQMVIPAELAYGETGNGSIPPGATLIFEVELLSVEDQPAP